MRRQRWDLAHTAEITVTVCKFGTVRHLKVRRRDGKDGIPWDVLQAAKDEMLGEESCAVEFYPPAHEVVNETNTRHLWEIEREWLPFGLNCR